MRRAACAVVVLAALAVAAPAHAQNPRETLTQPRNYAVVPAGRTHSAREMVVVATRVPKIARLLREHRDAYTRAYLKGTDEWQVSVFRPPPRGKATGQEIAQVLIDDPSGGVREAWTGVQVLWTMARGYPGAFGRKVNALYVWLPLCVLFLLPFARPPWRWLHADLLVILAFSVSYAFFNAAQLGASVPLAYPLLLYLLLRMLMIARNRQVADSERVDSWLPTDVLGVLVIFLLGFRFGLNLTNGNVIDVGYSGVIGADRIAHGDVLYGNFPADDPRGDTYGPVAYLAYLPFELIWPWHGTWDDLPAAHGAAVCFDWLAAGGLFWLGRRVRDVRLGTLLAYLWVACPFTLLAANSSSNDTLVGVCVLAALLCLAHPFRRGLAVGAGALTKFAPAALAPLLLARRRPLPAVLGATAAVVVACAIVLAPGGAGEFLDRTVGFQNDRGSPFSIWGYYGGLGALQTAVKLAAVALAVWVAVWRGARRDLAGVAALSAAVLIALQLAVTHWFYLYLVWFLPALFVALLVPRGVYEEGAGRSTDSIESARPA